MRRVLLKGTQLGNHPSALQVPGVPPLRLNPGEMAARFLGTDWAATGLGRVESWPASLRVAVGICLNSRFPMFVWWGPELVNIYNDAYVPVLGDRHPDAFGRPAREVWGDIWPTIRHQVDAVMRRGEATWSERAELTVKRRGYPELASFTWSMSPLIDDQGGVGGLICACIEETPRHARRAATRPPAEPRSSRSAPASPKRSAIRPPSSRS